MGNNGALSWLIRGMGVLLTLQFGLLIIRPFFTFSFYITCTNPQLPFLAGASMILFNVPIFGILIYLMSKSWRMVRKVDIGGVKLFAATFALLFAELCLRLYPLDWVGTITGLEIRALFMALVVLLLTYFMVKRCAIRVLGLGVPVKP